MNFYSFDDIKNANCCLRYAQEILPSLGYDIKNDRIQAKWRGGDGYNVALSANGWFDHKEKDGGSVISLCAMTMFGNDNQENIQKAQDYLGSWLGLTPHLVPVKREFDHRESARYKELVANGYVETKHYDYTDEDGRVCFTVYRLEHSNPAAGQKRKEFVQCSPYAPSIANAEKHLYNLPTISQSSWAVLTEGEKDADLLISWGIPATTCNNGAANWRDEYTEELRGKDVVICRDNDDAGLNHAKIVAGKIKDAAKTVRVVCPYPDYSSKHGGDVTDWAEFKGGTSAKFMAMISASKPIAEDDPLFSNEEYSVAQAKKANEKPFTNFKWEEATKQGKRTMERVAIPMSEMLSDLSVRFLGFPRRLGEASLFDFDRETDEINILKTTPDLLAWISDKSKHNYEWTAGTGFVTKDELYSAVVRRARRYEKVSSVPTYPEREDTFSTFREKLTPTPNHRAFNEFVNFFAPADDANALLLKCFIASPLFFRHGIPRPCWIIDSEDAWAVGKTTLVQMVARLYKDIPVCIDLSKRNFDEEKIMQRLLSATGRNARIFLMDNLRGVFDNPFFASLVTLADLSGRPPYGKGEETRPNDLTYVITANSARIGTDISSRSFFVFLKAHEQRQHWESDLMEFIERERFNIFADMIDMMETIRPSANFKTTTRFPVFEREVLYPICGGGDGYEKAMKKILTIRDEANVDNERVVQIGEIVRENIAKAIEPSVDPDELCVFLRNEVVDLWLSSFKMNTQDVRNLIKTKQIKDFSRVVRRYPRSNKNSPLSGILFIGSSVKPAATHSVYRLRLDAERKNAITYGGSPVLDRDLGSEIAELRAENDFAGATNAPCLTDPNTIDVETEEIF